MTGSSSRRSWRVRTCHGRELPLLQVRQQQRQGPIEDHRGISIRNRVSKQILRATQLLVRIGRHGDLHLVLRGRDWCDNGGASRLGRNALRDGLATWLQSLGLRSLRSRAWNVGRPDRRQFANRRCHRRLRSQSSNQVLHVALALVARRLEDLDVILRRQVRRQQTDGRQRDRAVCQ